MRFRRRLAKLALRGLLPLGVRLRVEGEEHLEPAPTLVAANHLAHMDPLILLHVVPDLPEFVALADLWRLPWLMPFLRLYAPIPVQRDRVDRSVICRVLASLKAGTRVVIFPEARISPSGRLEPARAGVAYFALRASVPVQPVVLWGTERLLHAWKQGRRGVVCVRVGRPIVVPPLNGRHVPKSQRTALTERIMVELARLLPPEYRGVHGRSTRDSEEESPCPCEADHRPSRSS
ncbi:MAG: lysophospholipid acyltransferase family protein [Ardenticatenia bacterium]|nr:lysophospholipid acyltransferase family protein [Ardenticatenia bacterium]